METFSEKYGYSQIRQIQREKMDEVLKTRLWNCATARFWGVLNYNPYQFYLKNTDSKEISVLIMTLWDGFFKKRIDELDDWWDKARKALVILYDKLEWNNVYDFLEYIVAVYPDKSVVNSFQSDCNFVFEPDFTSCIG